MEFVYTGNPKEPLAKIQPLGDDKIQIYYMSGITETDNFTEIHRENLLSEQQAKKQFPEAYDYFKKK